MRPIRPAIVVLFLALASLVATAGASAAAPLSIGVEGNRFVDGDGQTIRLLGVNHPSLEYACVQGYGLSDGHFDDADAAAIAGWNANAVRVPLNEDCWLGREGQPSGGYSKGQYRGAVESYVAALHAHGLYAILDLHWSAPPGTVAAEQQPMPDSQSTEFWSSVAATFEGDPAVVFDLFNEPFSPANPNSGDDPAHPVSWACWRDGGCPVRAYDEDGDASGAVYTAVGMQTLLDAIRATGATQPVMAGGLNYANELDGWLAHRPSDPLDQLAASFHNYQGPGKCDEVSCWDAEIAPVAAAVPVVTGEFGQSGCYPSNFDDEYMSWADAHGIGYLGWAWIVLSAEDMAAEGCDAYYLITDYAGTPSSLNGALIRNHLLSLPQPASAGGAVVPAASGGRGAAHPGAPPSTIRLSGFTVATTRGGRSVRLTLSASQSCAATIEGRTTRRFKLGARKARPVVLGTAHLSLNAGRPATVTIPLGAKARGLLARKGVLPVRFAVTLRGAGAPVLAEPTAAIRSRRGKHRGRPS